MLFMSLYLCTELETSMFVEINVRPVDNQPWAEGVRDPAMGRETVQQKTQK